MVRHKAAWSLAFASLFFSPVAVAQDGNVSARVVRGQEQTFAQTGSDVDDELTQSENEPVSRALTQDERPELIPANHFAERSEFTKGKLSPDGGKLSVVREVRGFASVLTISPTSGEKIHQVFLPEGFSVLDFRWAGNDRMLVEGLGTHTTRRYRYLVRKIFVVSLETGTARSLIQDPFLSSYADILRVDPGGQTAYIEHPEVKDGEFPVVYRYGLTQAGGQWLVQPKVKGVRDWLVDGQGTARIGIGREKGALRIWYREKSDAPLEAKPPIQQSDFNAFRSVLKINDNDDRGYVLSSQGGKPVGVHEYDFAAGKIVETIYEHGKWDVQSVYVDDGNPVAVTFIDDAERTVWFDPADAKLFDNLRKALGGDDIRLSVTSRSRDNGNMLIWAGNEADPGILYFFDRSRKNLSELTPIRPNLDFTKLVHPKPITYAARDGAKIRGYLTLPRGREAVGLPLIIMPHGGPYGVRDRLRYDDQVQLLANRGYAVLQPNYRGSGGYGEAFLDLGYGEVGRGMQDDLDDAMDWAVKQGIADPKRVCIVGGSYGGFAALWGVIRNPERYRCAASWAGVTDWDDILRHDRRFLTRYDLRKFRQRLEGERDFNLSAVSPVRAANKITRPVLLAHGTRDNIVPFEQFEDMVKAAKNAPVPLTTVVIHGARHSFVRSKDEKEWYDALDRFLAKHNPADQLDESGEWTAPIDPNEAGRFVPLVIGDGSEDE